MVNAYNVRIKDRKGRTENLVLQAPSRGEAKMQGQQWAGRAKRVVRVSRF